MLKINKKNILIKLSLILVIIIQLMYIVNKKVNFSFLILTNSLKDSYGAEYILPDEIIELKRILSDENLNRFDMIYAAAGHPYVVFEITFKKLCSITKGEVCNIVGD